MFTKRIVFSLLVFAVSAGLIWGGFSSACTIGAASGSATADGRPMIWKTRDTGVKNNELYYNTSGKYKFLSLINAGSTASWHGVNEKGFSILNSSSNDLRGWSRARRSRDPNAPRWSRDPNTPRHSREPNDPGSLRDSGNWLDNGTLMRYSLANCADVAEFEKLLEKTNVTGRRTAANFVVMDAKGEVAIFETGPKKFKKFDAKDPNVAPNGYILRSNFAFSAGEENNSSRRNSFNRYKRTSDLVKGFYADGKVTYKDILRTQMRDFSDVKGEAISVPFASRFDANVPAGYIKNRWSLCRASSASAALVVGVRDGEDPRLSTMWTLLGQPAAAVAVPYWPVGKTPPQADGEETAPLCDISRKITSQLVLRSTTLDQRQRRYYIDSYKLKDIKGNGLWAILFPVEDKIFAEVEAKLAKWRKSGPDVEDMLATEGKLAKDALATLEKASKKLETFRPDKGNLKETKIGSETDKEPVGK